MQFTMDIGESRVGATTSGLAVEVQNGLSLKQGKTLVKFDSLPVSIDTMRPSRPNLSVPGRLQAPRELDGIVSGAVGAAVPAGPGGS